jgi:hypothetical protein
MARVEMKNIFEILCYPTRKEFVSIATDVELSENVALVGLCRRDSAFQDFSSYHSVIYV